MILEGRKMDEIALGENKGDTGQNLRAITFFKRWAEIESSQRTLEEELETERKPREYGTTQAFQVFQGGRVKYWEVK